MIYLVKWRHTNDILDFRIYKNLRIWKLVSGVVSWDGSWVTTRVRVESVSKPFGAMTEGGQCANMLYRKPFCLSHSLVFRCCQNKFIFLSDQRSPVIYFEIVISKMISCFSPKKNPKAVYLLFWRFNYSVSTSPSLTFWSDLIFSKSISLYLFMKGKWHLSKNKPKGERKEK